MVGIFIDRFGKDIIIVPVDENHFCTTVRVFVSSHFLGWIMSLGDKVRITAPDRAVELMKKEIRRLNKQYDI